MLLRCCLTRSAAASSAWRTAPAAHVGALLTLSDRDAMMPALKLSDFAEVLVGARVSQSGVANAEPGDFYAEIEGISSIDPPDQLSLIIDRVKP